MQYQSVIPKQANSLRRAFINKFADKNLPQYRAVMGYCDTYGNNTHNGYLWEVLRPYTLISFERALSLISSFDELYVAWDNRSQRKMKLKQKTNLLMFSGKELFEILRRDRSCADRSLLPEDFYVFNKELDFHITFTNRIINGIGNVCMTNLENLDDTGISPLMKELIELTGFGSGSYL